METLEKAQVCSATTTFRFSAFGLLSPARLCIRRRSSLTLRDSNMVCLSFAVAYTDFGKCLRLHDSKLRTIQKGYKRGNLRTARLWTLLDHTSISRVKSSCTLWMPSHVLLRYRVSLMRVLSRSARSHHLNRSGQTSHRHYISSKRLCIKSKSKSQF